MDTTHGAKSSKRPCAFLQTMRKSDKAPSNRIIYYLLFPIFWPLFKRSETNKVTTGVRFLFRSSQRR